MHSTTKLHFGPDYKEVEVGHIATVATAAPLRLQCGVDVRAIPVAYQTYGQLNAAKDNAILVCHGLTGDQYAAGTHPVTGKPGWWEDVIGSGKAIDTDRFFVIAPNVIGGCMGSFGPKTLNPATGEPYNLDFPVITVRDMVAAQVLLLDALGIDKLACVIGGSMGGMLALEWAVSHPARVRSVMPISTAARHTAQNIAFHEIGRQAIMADPDWHGGQYIAEKAFPVKGLSVARMTAHVTYLSEEALSRKFGRRLQDRDAVTFGFDADFQVESYLRHQGMTFVERFDPNAYLYITRAMDYFDLLEEHGGELSRAFAGKDVAFCLVSFTSDWLYPTAESKRIVHALNGVAARVSFVEITSDKGHDAFLLDEPVLRDTIAGFLKSL